MARRRRKVIGNCRLCGSLGPLSFEHVPPRAAFNARPVVGLAGSKVLERFRSKEPRGPVEQRGMGEYTLCKRCNERTGHWYGSALVSWCAQGLAVLQAAKGAPSLDYPYYLHPLRVVKQIVAMFFSINAPGFRREVPELAAFVLNPERRVLPKPFRVFVFFTTSNRMRLVGWAIRQRDGVRTSLTEITYPPFGYVMTGGHPAPHRDLVEITEFGNYNPEDFRMLHLALRVLPVVSPFPGDYRTEEEVARMRETATDVTIDGKATSWKLVRVDEG